MKLRILAILFSVLSIYGNAQKYINPMDIPVVLSASFAELRPNHFHAGLDISTSGVIGVPVKSVADGYVSRIKVSPFGYGHGLYITHYDGHTTVYGHLSEYAEKIDSVIRKEQYKIQNFEADYYPDSNAIKVSKGEIIAYSGNTGSSGGPHLHFEVRDTKSDVALNPLQFLETIQDHQAPTVYGIKMYALSDTSTIANAAKDKYFLLNEIQNRTIEAYGHIGLGINAVDFFDIGGRPCGVVEVSLFVNDSLVFLSRLDSVPFDKSRYINSFIDYGEVQNFNRYIQKSFIEENNQLEIFKYSKPIVITEGKNYRIKYVLKDFSFNSKTVNFNIKGKKNPNTETQKPIGKHVCWATDFIADTLDIFVKIPAGTLYQNEYLEFSRQDSTTYKRPLYTIGSKEIPAHQNFTLTIPIPKDYLEQIGKIFSEKQVFIARQGKKNTLGYVGGTITDSVITVNPRFFGNYLIATDTIAPRVVSKNSSTYLSKCQNIMIGIADNFSGIAKYNCFIDNDWKLFEYDYKNARLIAQVKKLGLSSGAHELLCKVEDNCGNEKVFVWKFRVR